MWLALLIFATVGITTVAQGLRLALCNGAKRVSYFYLMTEAEQASETMRLF
jgi:hypothetical protein